MVGDASFIAWGTRVEKRSGIGGRSVGDRGVFVQAHCAGVETAFPREGLVAASFGLVHSPLFHRRGCFSFWHRSFKYLDSVRKGEVLRLPADIRDEILGAALLVSACHSNIRRPVSSFHSRIDANLSSGGAVRCTVGAKLASVLYRMIEARDCHVILDHVGSGPLVERLASASAEVSEIAAAPLFLGPFLVRTASLSGTTLICKRTRRCSVSCKVVLAAARRFRGWALMRIA